MKLAVSSYHSIYKSLCQSSYLSIYFSISADNPEYSKFVPGSDKSIYLYTADFIEKVFGVYTRSMLTIYLSLRAQVAVGTIFMKWEMSIYLSIYLVDRLALRLYFNFKFITNIFIFSINVFVVFLFEKLFVIICEYLNQSCVTITFFQIQKNYDFKINARTGLAVRYNNITV